MMAPVLTVLLGAYDQSPVRHTQPFRPLVVTDSRQRLIEPELLP